ncbi:hypothetical protein AB0C12_32245 [Actinoplanes sp. NPDC048967]|uniref:SbtR family transcriptional regulator n=1 Tax=Actinoplanes sp. NPDC048967 TaxID=3155269 RepID=UPI0034080C5E
MLHDLVAMRPLVLLARRFDPGARDRYQQRLLAAFGEPLRRAQSQGYVRSDVTPADLLLLLAMVQAVAESTEDRATVDGSIELVLDGVFNDLS